MERSWLLLCQSLNSAHPYRRTLKKPGGNESDCEFCENCEKKIFDGWLGGFGGGFGATNDLFDGLLDTMKNGISIECRSHSNGTDVSTVVSELINPCNEGRDIYRVQVAQ